MKKSPKQIRKILNLNATQIDTIQGNYRTKNMVKAPDLTFDGLDNHNTEDVYRYHNDVMNLYTKKAPSYSHPRNILKNYADKSPNDLIPMQGYVIDMNTKNRQNPMILLAQPKIVDFDFTHHLLLVDTHMWLPVNKIAVLDDETNIQPTISKTHILDIHQGDLLIFSAAIKQYRSHGKEKYGFNLINVSGCGLPVANPEIPVTYQLLDDYDLTSHLISLVNIPTVTEFYNAKSHGLFAIEQLYQKTFCHLIPRQITHYWKFFDK